MVLRLSALRAVRTFTPPGRFLVLISVRGSVDPCLICSAAGMIRSIEKSSDLIGNRTRDLPACCLLNQLRYRVPHLPIANRQK
jgi:hypothetical protein